MTNKCMRVLFICHYASPYGGNFVASLLSLESKINQSGGSCVYVFPEQAKNREWVAFLKNNGKSVMFYDFYKSRIFCLKEINKIVKKFDINIIYTHFGQDINAQLYGKLHRKVKIVCHIHCDFSLGKNVSKKEKALRIISYNVLAHRVGLIGVSEYIAQLSRNITWIPNCLSDNRVSCIQRSRQEIRKASGVSDEESLALIFGWSPAVKGIDIAINAVAKIHNECNMKLAIVCGSKCTPDKMKQYIAENTEYTGDEPFLIYFEPSEDVFGFYKAADIFISASRSEGFPYSLLEALSIGKRCVVSDIPSVQWCKKYDQVFPFESENPDSCARALKNALEHNDADYSYAAKQIAQDYSINNWCDRVIGVFLNN